MRTGLVGILLACLAAGCNPEPPLVIVTTEPLSTEQVAVAEARGELATPLVALARAVDAATDDLDVLRHELPRGPAMADAVLVMDGELDRLATAAELLADAAEATLATPLPAAVAEAAGAAAGFAGQARLAVPQTRRELALLGGVIAFDRDVGTIPEAWDAPGSRSERRAALERLQVTVAQFAARVASLPDSPTGCDGLAVNRARWTITLQVRTAELTALAGPDTGTQYDAARTRYRRAPYGEDRAVADAATRPCWEIASALPRLQLLGAATVERVEELLQPGGDEQSG